VVDVNLGESTDSMSADTDVLRRMTLAAAVLVVIQVAIGMVVNLYVTVPTHHPGAHPTNYLSGSFHSVVWAIGHGAIALAFHGALGLALILMAITVAVRAVTMRTGRVAVSSVLGALLVIGAAFNGASFHDFGGQNISSLLMALLALGALCCYLLGLYLLPARRWPDAERACAHCRGEGLARSTPSPIRRAGWGLRVERMTRIELALSAWESVRSGLSGALSCGERCP
jgi:hypothetical protein